MKKNKSENIPVDFSILNDMPTDFKIDRITREAGSQMKTSHMFLEIAAKKRLVRER